jgi:hypothetical protein
MLFVHRFNVFRSCSGMQGNSCGFGQCMSSVVPVRTVSSSHFIPHCPHVVANVLLSVFWGKLMPALHATYLCMWFVWHCLHRRC